ncbi:hypothetical protein M231_07261 [Tremella mesenterica]|uniref:Phosphotyrosine protein phosphatase I domain-containing protein n=1 Tax=Tremella mesenterica TaxID=5217 RepID=A0A4Q1BFW5_TREME|nr:hypothetical protein M231_07261 [Tremella mesenterica]
MADQPVKVRVLMVCTGICRSPMAEAVLVHLYNQRPALKQKVELHVDSAGTDAYHVGESADPRTIQTCKKHGIPISNKARKLRADDWNFDYLLAMDTSHLSHLNRKASTYKSKSHISLFGSFDPTFLPTSSTSAHNSSETSRSLMSLMSDATSSKTSRSSWSMMQGGASSNIPNTSTSTVNDPTSSKSLISTVQGGPTAKTSNDIGGDEPEDKKIEDSDQMRRNVIWEKGKSIPDPYYGSQRGFEQCYESCVIYSNGFLDHLERSYS